MTTVRSILVVEDDEQVRRYLVQLLEKADWVATAVETGDAALDVLAKKNFGLILCDLDLGPGPSGIDVLRRRPPVDPIAPFVLLTAYGTIDRCQEALHAGAAYFIEKPVSPARLLATLAKVRGVEKPTGDISESAPAEMDQVGHRHLRRALQVINRRSAELDFTVSELARELEMTPEHLSRLFRTHLDTTPLEQIHVARIKASENLLRNAPGTIYEVARNCGYRTTKDFDVWFTRLNGLTPSSWRSLNVRR